MPAHMERIVVKVPASTANLGSGFDSIGIAFQLYTTIEVELADNTQFIWKGNELSRCSFSDEDNLILKGMSRVFDVVQQDRPHFRVVVNSDIPITRGLGSSASAYVAGLVAANHYLHQPLTDEDLLWLATEEEGHPDNVGASIYGGIVIASVDWKNRKVQYHKQAFPEGWQWLAAIPSYVLSTSEARELLPKHYAKEDAIYNVSRYGLLVASLLTGNKAGVSVGFEDALHQPYRQHLIPGFEQLVQLKEELGVIGFVISGAGPTVLSLVEKEANQENIMQTMRELMKVQDHTIQVQPVAVEGNGYSVQTIHSENPILLEQ